MVVKGNYEGKCESVRLTNEGYYVNRHSCFLLQYHLVLVTKYRRPVIVGQVEQDLLSYTRNFFAERECRIQAIESMPDHIHILFDAPTSLMVEKFVNAYKSVSSRYVRQRNAEVLAKTYNKPYFWSLSYFIATTSERSTAAVKRYIEHQKG